MQYTENLCRQSSNFKSEQRQRTHNCFYEKVEVDRGEERLRPDIEVEVDEEQLTKIIDGGVKVSKAPETDRKSAVGRYGKRKSYGKMPGVKGCWPCACQYGK